MANIKVAPPRMAGNAVAIPLVKPALTSVAVPRMLGRVIAVPPIAAIQPGTAQA